MLLTGTLKEISKDNKGNTNISFTITNYSQQVLAQELKEEKYSIEVKKYVDRRTIRQNAYLWKLISVIDETINGIATPESEMSIYISALLKAGAKYTVLCCESSLEDELRQKFRAIQYIKPYSENENFNVYRVFYGSSKMDKKEFSLLVDAIKQMGYECGVEMSYWEEVLQVE